MVGSDRKGEVIRFCIVGVAATAIHYLVYYLLLGTLHHNIAYTLGYVVSFVCNYYLSSRFTFHVAMSSQKLVSFALTHLVNYLLHLALFNIFLLLGVPKTIAPLPVFALVVPVNFLLVRYVLKRRNTENDAYRLFLIVAGLAMLGLQLLDTPTLNDDMVYRFMFQHDLNAAVRPIESLGDFLKSQWFHYQLINGRYVVHFIAQAMLVFMPLWVIHVVNTLFFVLLLHLCVCWMKLKGKQQLFAAAMISLLLLLVVKDISTTFLWSLGAFNYLWVLTATMGLLLYLQHIDNESLSSRHWLLAPLAFFIGWSHEGLSLPLSIAFAFCLWTNRKTIRNKATTPYLLLYIIGTLMVLISPALWNRAGGGITMFNRLFSGVINLAFNMRIGWLLLLTMIVMWKRQRSLIRQELQGQKYLYIALLMSLGIVFLCGTNLDRVPFFADFLAMLLLLRLWSQMFTIVWQRRLVMCSCVIMLLLYAPIIMVRQDNRQVWQQMEAQMMCKGQELIAVPSPAHEGNAVLDLFRTRFVNPTVEFGFYCVYMAFDKNDINIRCAAKYADKQQLVFLPKNIVERIKADSTAFTNYELDLTEKLYVWKLPENIEVKKLSFVLNKEDLSALSFFQRLLAYKEDTFELDSFHHEVLDIYGHSYLVFTRPTTNITRRLHHIEYE